MSDVNISQIGEFDQNLEEPKPAVFVGTTLIGDDMILEIINNKNGARQATEDAVAGFPRESERSLGLRSFFAPKKSYMHKNKIVQVQNDVFLF